jgi:hypothetical protein
MQDVPFYGQPPANYCPINGDGGEYIIDYAKASGVPVCSYGGYIHVPVWLILAWELKLDTVEGMYSMAYWPKEEVITYLSIIPGPKQENA